MTSTNDSIIFYNEFNKLPKFDATGNLIDSGLNGAIDGISEGLSEFLGEKVFGENKVFKILFSGDVLGVFTTNREIRRIF
jgi:hypothetical protein